MHSVTYTRYNLNTLAYIFMQCIAFYGIAVENEIVRIMKLNVQNYSEYFGQ